MDSFKNIYDIIDKYRNIVITTHLVPDGDAIGSVLSMYYFLKSKGKNPVVINHSPTPPNFEFLDSGIIKVFYNNQEENEKIINECDLILVLDTNEYSRTKSMEQILRNSTKPKICIDHHLGINDKDFTAYISDTDYPANCQLLFDFYKTIDADAIDDKIASLLYTGIMTDTGGFRFPRTSSQTFITAAELIQRGADPVELYDKVYGNTSLRKLKLISRFIHSLEFFNEGRLCIGYVTQKDFGELGLKEDDMEGLSAYTMDIDKVRAGIVVVELKTGLKLSFRSKGEINMNGLAKEFGGGGHKNAAGARVYDMNLHQLKEKILELKDKYIP
ncbi:MAG: bifunctional oligoribonuclease/PAP phosphatase NrnA [Ignavibacteria bacterium]|nr:bifunctional oligoribonuclease/PAP phosphatase NrnA [Ignavibacteria bacterium]